MPNPRRDIDRLYLINHTVLMEVRRTDVFDKWLKNLSGTVGKFMIDARIRQSEEGPFDDVKHVGGNVFEMWIHRSPG